MDNKISLSEKVFSKPGYKFLLFLISYILAVVVTLGVLAIINRGPFWDNLFSSEFLTVLILFPYGFLGWPIFQFVDVNSPSLSIGWITYLVITSSAVFIKNHRAVRTLFFIFIFLLLLNILGCVALHNQTV